MPVRRAVFNLTPFDSNHIRIARRTCSLSRTPSLSRRVLKPSRSSSSIQKLNRCLITVCANIHTLTYGCQIQIGFQSKMNYA